MWNYNVHYMEQKITADKRASQDTGRPPGISIFENLTD